jgi:hypothetical protein
MLPVTRLRDCFLALPIILTAGVVAAQELPEGFLISSIPNRSDRMLNDPRIVCAAGRHAAAEKRAVESSGVAQ